MLDRTAALGYNRFIVELCRERNGDHDEQKGEGIHSLPDIALMLVSSLHYVRDMNLQLGFAVKSTEERAASSNAVPEVLSELKKLSNRADTLSLWMQEELCRRLRAHEKPGRGHVP